MNIRSRAGRSAPENRGKHNSMTVTPIDIGRTAAPNLDARQRILEAAMRCFSDSGFHSASMQQICAAANMSPGGVYRYFASKDEIIGAIFEHVHARNAQYFERMAAEGATLDTFADVGFSCLRDLTQGPERGLFCEVFAEAQRNPELRAAFESGHEQARTMMRNALKRLQDIGEIDQSLDVDVVSMLLKAIGDGLIVRLRGDGEVDFETLWPSLKTLINRMLRPEGTPTAQTPTVQS